MFRIRKLSDARTPANRKAVAEAQEIIRAQFPGMDRGRDRQAARPADGPVRAPLRRRALRRRAARPCPRAWRCCSTTRRWSSLSSMSSPTRRASARARARAARSTSGCARRRSSSARRASTSNACPTSPSRRPNEAFRKQNIARLRFYERFGARPIEGTDYQAPIKPGDLGMPHLVFDGLGRHELPAADTRCGRSSPRSSSASTGTWSRPAMSSWSSARSARAAMRCARRATSKRGPAHRGGRAAAEADPADRQRQARHPPRPRARLCRGAGAHPGDPGRDREDRPVRAHASRGAFPTAGSARCTTARWSTTSAPPAPRRRRRARSIRTSFRSGTPRESPRSARFWPATGASTPSRRSTATPGRRRGAARRLRADRGRPGAERRAARLCADPPARAPCRAPHLWRVLLYLQRRGGGELPVAFRDSRDPRHRLPPRQRPAGHLLRARRRADGLDPRRPELCLSLFHRLSRRARAGRRAPATTSTFRCPRRSRPSSTARRWTAPSAASTSTHPTIWSSRSASIPGAAIRRAPGRTARPISS